jgi:hypothetical protein
MGSDVGSMQMYAYKDGNEWVTSGTKKCMILLTVQAGRKSSSSLMHTVVEQINGLKCSKMESKKKKQSHLQSHAYKSCLCLLSNNQHSTTSNFNFVSSTLQLQPQPSTGNDILPSHIALYLIVCECPLLTGLILLSQ